MGFIISTSLGTVQPRDVGQENGLFPIAACPAFDDINDGEGGRDWTQTDVIAEVSTKQYSYAFKQGRSQGVRYGLEMRDGLNTEKNLNAYYTPSYIGFCAVYTDASQTEATLYFVWTAPVSGEEQALGYMQQYNGGDYSRIFGFTVGTYKQADFPEEWDETPTEDEDNPNNTDPRGGEYADLGNFYETDDMPLSGLPNTEDLEQNFNGLITCYSWFDSEMQEFGKSVFQTSFWQSLMNKFSGLSDPLSFILDCTEIPIYDVPDDVVVCEMGGIEVPLYSGGTYFTHALRKRYYSKNCGSMSLKEMWGSAKDYTDTSISIYLPYCGVKELDPDIVLRTSLTLYIYVDLWTGDVLYLLHTSNADTAKKYYKQENVCYRWTGNCGKKIPMGRVDTSNQILQLASGIATVGLGVAAGGALGGLGFGGAMTMGEGVAGAAIMEGGRRLTDVATNGFRPIVQTSGGVGGAVGRMDYQYPYLIIKRGVPEYPNNWRAEFGAPQYQSYTLSDLLNTGYTLFSEIQLGNMGNANEDEKAELERLLKTEGVIL